MKQKDGLLWKINDLEEQQRRAKHKETKVEIAAEIRRLEHKHKQVVKK